MTLSVHTTPEFRIKKTAQRQHVPRAIGLLGALALSAGLWFGCIMVYHGLHVFADTCAATTMQYFVAHHLV